MSSELTIRPRILVLLATYNGSRWLQDQMDSILRQEDVDVHIAISDDASSDGTADLVEALWGNDPRVCLKKWSSGSGSAGANFRRLFRSVSLDGFDWVALADQDDIWLPRKLIHAAEVSTASGAKGYSGSVQAFWSDGRVKVLGQSPATRDCDFLFEGAGQGCTFLIKTDLFARVQKFCVDHADAVEALHYHDWLIYLLARSWKDPWHFDPTVTMQYRQHAGNEIGARGGWASVLHRVRLIRSGWYGGQIRAAARLHTLAAAKDNAPSVTRMVKAALGPKSRLLDRPRIAWAMLRHGRRRLADRCVLAASAMFGWIF